MCSKRNTISLCCPQCGQSFTTLDKRQTYCSRPCAIEANSGENHYAWKGRFRNVYGYEFVHKPTHPAANKRGYVREHILVATEMIGRPLLPEECVHHINGVRHDNRPENLQVLTFSQHSRIHMADVPSLYSDDELIAALHEMRDRLGRNPRKRDVDRFPDLPGRKAFQRHFGRWNLALQAAGLPINMRQKVWPAHEEAERTTPV